jgi:hypothetical protein
MTDERIHGQSGTARWWPCFGAGILWPFASRVLVSWLPAYAAAAAAFALLWIIAGLVFLRWPPSLSWRFARWINGALLGAAVCGLLTYLLT